uniref:Uncharacterized protein n=1 Tax=Kalanchoe fedtschenkoi TaxID=63787 RepID=A0A7N0SXF1_KALFE
MTSHLPAPASQVHLKLLKTHPSHRALALSSVQARGRHFAARTVRRVVAQLNEPNIPKIELAEVKKRLLEVIPEPVKQVPWKNAERIFLNKLLEAGEKTLKWVFIPLFVLSAFCDIVFSILKNKELLIPIGLFIGCTVSDLFNETSRELFHKSEGSGPSRRLLYIAAFFVATRFVCSSFPLTASVFFMHVANGGLMQALWLWRNSHESVSNSEPECSVLSRDASRRRTCGK